MKRSMILMLLSCGLPGLLPAQIGIYQHGSVVRMHMGDCLLTHRGFMAAFGGPAAPEIQEACPEYTLVANSVVFVIVGKSSNQLIPLAETIDFRLQKNELVVRVDDAKHELRFAIREMIVRSDWERMQRHIDQQIKAAEASRQSGDDQR
jgi:hypothetical protein